VSDEPIPDSAASWDGAAGTAGGKPFGAALAAAAREQGLEGRALAEAAGLAASFVEALCDGRVRATAPQLARLALALRLRAIEFMQKTQLLSLEVYALGLDPLYFLPEGPVRKDARIYMREINPRHAVPERDMLVRNPTLKAILADELLDPAGRLELELTYLLRTACQRTGGVL
jgi:transcriptional regulator with XRE-family HTH domain